ncbi:hypothetical protein FB45DRAFT_921398 [Roridomyces roridus]|uniref:Uncharacterized protein n=1 Tax=Roridomyces roridus TaxID=1738132 RepID=A0AAD7BRE3_9AGAR|nr:hypothetical protein FB45DRAFT_921398 [Roridomyces roridus]
MQPPPPSPSSSASLALLTLVTLSGAPPASNASTSPTPATSAGEWAVCRSVSEWEDWCEYLVVRSRMIMINGMTLIYQAAELTVALVLPLVLPFNFCWPLIKEAHVI